MCRLVHGRHPTVSHTLLEYVRPELGTFVVEMVDVCRQHSWDARLPRVDFGYVDCARRAEGRKELSAIGTGAAGRCDFEFCVVAVVELDALDHRLSVPLRA